MPMPGITLCEGGIGFQLKFESECAEFFPLELAAKGLSVVHLVLHVHH